MSPSCVRSGGSVQNARFAYLGWGTANDLGRGRQPVDRHLASRPSSTGGGIMSGFVRQVWLAVRPVTQQQRFLWWCGTLLMASGLAHAVVAVIDGGAWWGPVSWRKLTVFGLSLGLL